MAEYSHLKVFSEKGYSEIETDRINVPRIGDIILTEDEEKILQKHPKFAILQNLQEHTMKEDMEKSYSLVRMELREEEDTPEYDIRSKTGEKIEQQNSKEEKET